MADLYKRTPASGSSFDIAGQWRASGEFKSLPADQARELAPPFWQCRFPYQKERGADHAGFGGTKRRKRQVS
ncbi:hypothetical protein C9417_17735 [Rhizobium sp. SEMIA 4088]|nr:hypothetical protein C9417_17735 [Rhizobium sp. SEMIA 4088]